MRTAVETIPQRVHLVGVGGIHMSAIAQVLLARGHTVSGSDLYLTPLTERLEAMGVTVSRGHDAAHLGDAEMVVYTSAAPEDNPELVEAHRRGLPTIKRAQMVARLMEGKRAIAVAGTHGKTTTSSLIAFMLWQAGRSPTFMLGGEMLNLETNALPGEGPDFVVEADEFDAAFLNYHPDIALVTNVEPDHLDIYGSYQGLLDAFRRFLSQVKPDGYIVACPSHIGGNYYTARAGTDNSNFFSSIGCHLRNRFAAAVHIVPVGDKSFQPTYRNSLSRILKLFTDCTCFLTLNFLRTHPPANRRQK